MNAFIESVQEPHVDTFGPITHWCWQCDSHHPIHRVRCINKATVSPIGEVEVLICPNCSSYDIEELQEVSNAQ